MGGTVQRPRLRAKTGCLPCKNRRKKCDEERPSCQRCRTSGFTCQWPTSVELIDRRYASHPARRKSPSPAPSAASRETTPSCSDLRVLLTREQLPLRFSIDPKVSRYSESASHQLLCYELESVIARHFVDKYYSLLLLPSCHPRYFHGWIAEIQHLMLQHKCLRYSVLACAAAHMHYTDESPQMQELSLTYYSRAIRGLSEIIASLSQLENHNGVLMSIMLLYLHGCMGRGTYNDIPRHVNAAIRILKLRLLDLPLNISQPFDRLAVESVMYQIFLVATGSWSDPFELDYNFDAEFWLRAENLLMKSKIFPSAFFGTNSPVLGVPLALFKLVLSIKQLWRRPASIRHDRETLEELRAEVKDWEKKVPPESEGAEELPQDTFPGEVEIVGSNYTLYNDATHLYILASSLLVQQLSEKADQEEHEDEEGNEEEDDAEDDDDDDDDETDVFTTPNKNPPVPSPATPSSWQVRKAIAILQSQRDNDHWSRCYIGNWPVYTLGYFMIDPADVRVVQRDLQRRWELTKFSQVDRFRRDVEGVWARRGPGVVW